MCVTDSTNAATGAGFVYVAFVTDTFAECIVVLLVIAPPSQELEPPTKPGRFTPPGIRVGR